jgi:hypothetical protein
MWKQLVSEIKVAQQALKDVGANFSLGTNGWCLGPGDNASFFDKVIPDPSFKIAAINGRLGWPVPTLILSFLRLFLSWCANGHACFTGIVYCFSCVIHCRRVRDSLSSCASFVVVVCWVSCPSRCHCLLLLPCASFGNLVGCWIVGFHAICNNPTPVWTPFKRHIKYDAHSLSVNLFVGAWCDFSI